jgi:hypothetical protein
MSDLLPTELKKLIAFMIYSTFLLATSLSYLGNPSPTWADTLSAIPPLLPFFALTFLRDERPLMWILDGTVASLNWIIDYASGTLPDGQAGRHTRS